MVDGSGHFVGYVWDILVGLLVRLLVFNQS